MQPLRKYFTMLYPDGGVKEREETFLHIWSEKGIKTYRCCE